MALLALEKQGDIAVLRLNSGVTNPIGPELVNELSQAFARGRAEFRGLMLSGGDKFFSIGLDLPRLLPLDRAEMGLFFYSFSQTLLDLFTLPVPTACAIKGHAVGAGKTLLLACDYRYAAEGRTLIGLNEIKLGVPTPYLPDLILRQIAGDAVASDMLYRGEFIESSDAMRKGIIHAVFPKHEVEGQALERLAELASLPAHAYAATKRNRTEVIRSRYAANYESRTEEFLDHWFSPPTQLLLKEGAKKFSLEGRPIPG
jgi:enoyl-CoA hydratase/carnithine racemase